MSDLSHHRLIAEASLSIKRSHPLIGIIHQTVSRIIIQAVKDVVLIIKMAFYSTTIPV